jgi:hypothetical protein
MGDFFVINHDDVNFFVEYKIDGDFFHINDVSLRKGDDVFSMVKPIESINIDKVFKSIEKHIKDSYSVNTIQINVFYNSDESSSKALKQSLLRQNVKVLNTLVKLGYDFVEYDIDTYEMYEHEFQFTMTKNF